MKIDVELIHSLHAHKDCIYALEKIDDEKFLTGGGDGLLIEWDLTKPYEAHSLANCDSSIYAIEMLSQERLLIGTNSGEIYIINRFDKKVEFSLKLNKGIFQIKISKNYAICCLADGELVKLDLVDLSIIHKVKVSNGHIRSIVESHMADTYILGTSDNELITINADLEVIKAANNAHNDSVFSLLKSTNNIISGGKDALLKLWNRNLDEIINEVPAHLFAINDLVSLPNTPYVISASRDKSIKIWDNETLLLKKVIDKTKFNGASTHSVNRLDVIDENKLIAVGDDRVVRVYRIVVTY